MLVLSPSTLQEAVDMTWEAFELADKYSKPVLLLMDGFTGTMMEPVELPEPLTEEQSPLSAPPRPGPPAASTAGPSTRS